MCNELDIGDVIYLHIESGYPVLATIVMINNDGVLLSKDGKSIGYVNFVDIDFVQNGVLTEYYTFIDRLVVVTDEK
jgi:hypothetical protein